MHRFCLMGRRAAAILFSVALAFLFIEGGLRVLGARNMVLYERDDVAGYRVKPMQDVHIGGVRVVVNEWGVRDARPFFSRKPGVRRILVLGDSVTWGGLGIPQEKLFTSVLERKLPNCEVVNAGVNGYSVAQMVALYQSRLKELEPDLVLVFAIPRDFERPPVTELTGSSVAFPLEKPRWALPVGFALLRWHAGRLLGWDMLQEKPSSIARGGETAGEHQIATNVAALRTLAECLPKGAALHLVLCPVAEPMDDPRVEQNIMEQVAAAGIMCSGLRQTGALPANSFTDGVHLNEEGHEAVGKALAALLGDWRTKPMAIVRVQEEVYRFEPPNNGSGPMWSHGNTQVVCSGEDVFVSQMETGRDVLPLSNTRWRLLRRGAQGWETVAMPGSFSQREPCPLAVMGKRLFLSVNDLVEPPGTRYGRCEPGLLRFDIDELEEEPQRILPNWGDPLPHFTDHSYRGLAADPTSRRLLVLHIDAQTSLQHWCYLTEEGETLRSGAIGFPIRACYPQVALQGKAAYVLAVGDIYEPVEEWRAYKREKLQREWDYVFRILYFTWTPDILAQDFMEPIEIANVDATAGNIFNQDLWVSPSGQAYILYTEQPVASELLRDRFFPGLSVTRSLFLAVVDQGKLIERRVIWEGNASGEPVQARFHETPDGRLYVVAFAQGEKAGNYLASVYPDERTIEWVPIPLEPAFVSYCLADRRSGCEPSYTIHIHGHTNSAERVDYAEVEIR